MRYTLKRPSRYLYINIILLTVISIVYILSTSSRVQSALHAAAGAPLFRGSRSDAVALVCAVRWDAAALPDMLSICEENRVSMTFFVYGEWAEKNPWLLKKMRDEGHEIGTLGYDKSGDDVEKGAAAIANILGTRPMLYMPPEDQATPKQLRAAADARCQAVICSIDAMGARTTDAQLIQNRVLGHVFGGAIVRMAPTRSIVEALPGLIAGMHEKQYQCMRASEVLFDKPV